MEEALTIQKRRENYGQSIDFDKNNVIITMTLFLWLGGDAYA